ncbi:Adenylosuccinate synthetase [Paenibacillus sp. UNCCL117]|uniref:adenylosuccinate synthase n=1 Tax=unclassified Paenibacillus TaxID=185978 RepID=UPI00088D2925|nr:MULTISPECIES: adenylosuccinate synthase [unclassified Paenibacillus]SDB98559.1 Adenylosuccinate synthetase [Paenibacillus sp. cl123]SFW68970.1 Adenylosuccinate synthetase [Paenibacillus sp. UNCCL117]
MSVTAVVGANWGDEGKGKMTDVLAEEARYVVRFQGGSNAGHTVVNSYGKFALRLLPSGVFHTGTVNVIGPGVALHLPDFWKEREMLIARGVPEPSLLISDRAQVLLGIHKLLDELEEDRLGDRRFGSTKSGIAPFYSDKYMKLGIQVADLFEPERLKSRVECMLVGKNVLLRQLYNKAEISAEAVLRELEAEGERIKPFVCNTTILLQEAWRRGEKVLLEGQLGALRDPDHGIYPFSTSSSPLAGFAAVGAGLPPHAIQRIVAVVKAYSSCVGEGPFVTEIHGSEADELRRRGGDAGEYGVNTGRPRRMGWFDAVATRYGCMLQGATEAALTNLDVLGYLDEILICTAYQLDGVAETAFPVSARIGRSAPVFENLPGWKSDISEVRTFRQLPEEAKAYVRHIEHLIGVPVRYISNGPRRDQVIERD